jgi:23S rRNA G2445 N2-methylase RlmL
MKRLEFSADDKGTLTHRLFRYPAKFHAPVAATLVERYSDPGQTILDPFCGSGTIMVEASVRGRRSFGSDLDPLAVAVSKVKTTALEQVELERATDRFRTALRALDRGSDEYARLATTDISEEAYAEAAADLSVPDIPRIQHWFRRYVIIDLGRIFQAIDGLGAAPEYRDWLRIVVASIIRNASNADPVPVSGLEVTAHMRRLDEAGRIVDPVTLVDRALTRAAAANAAYVAARNSHVVVSQADAASLQLPIKPDVLITSPPYQNAVDYYRRHQLEMFWLGLTKTHAERLKLLPRYIGKHRVAASNPVFQTAWTPSSDAQRWLDTMQDADEGRARDFRAYMTSMDQVFHRWHELLAGDARAVCVVGRSNWQGAGIPTEQLFIELAADRFALEEHLTYPVKNRYMSYTRRNGANIDEEHVLVFKRLR